MRDPTDLRGQEIERLAEAERFEHQRRQEIEDFKWLMAHKPGRRFLRRLLSMSGMFRTSWTGNGSQTIFNEGMRNFGLMLMDEINEHSIEGYLTMLKEQKVDE